MICMPTVNSGFKGRTQEYIQSNPPRLKFKFSFKICNFFFWKVFFSISKDENIVSYPPPPLNQDFKQDQGEFFWKFCGEEGTKGGDSMFCGSSVGENLLTLVNFFLMSCKNNLSILIWRHVQNINSLTVATSWLTIMRSTFFISSCFL